MYILVVLLAAVFLRNKTEQQYISPLVLVLVVIILLDAQIIRRSLRKLVGERLPGESTRGLTMYAVMRALQIRRFRVPALRVRPGEKSKIGDHGLPAPRPERPEDQRDRVRKLDHPRFPGAGAGRRRVRARRPRRGHHHLRHRRRVRGRAGRGGPRAGPARRTARVHRDGQGVLAHRRRAERPGPVAQAHHRVPARLAAQAGNGRPRPVPGAPVRPRDPDRRDHARLRRPG